MNEMIEEYEISSYLLLILEIVARFIIDICIDINAESILSQFGEYCRSHNQNKFKYLQVPMWF